MRVITPFALASRWPENKHIIFVGNAPSLLGEGLGQWIDSHDIVVRFNYCPTRNYSQDTGERTDILVTNPYPEGRATASSEIGSNPLIVVITPQTRRGNEEEFFTWAGDADVFFTYSPDLVQVGNIEHRATLTTGTYAIHLLTRVLAPASVSISGFTMFLPGTEHHYFSPNTPKGLSGHDPRVEARLLIRVCNSLRCQTVVTEELLWVSRQVGEPLRPTIRVRTLKHARWKL